MTGILQDIRFALRQFAARPLFTFAAITTLAFGIGANAAIFSVVNGLLLHPLPFAEADRLAIAWRSSPANEMMLTPDGELIERWRESTSSFEAIEAWTTEDAVVRTDAGPRVVRVAAISDGLLPALRLAPELGRGFVREDEAAGAEPVVLLSHSFWRAEFGGDEAAIGRTLPIGGTAHTIVGVAPVGLAVPVDFGADPDLWFPLRRNARGRLEGVGLQTIVRLRHGVDRARAEADLAAVSARAAEDGDDSSFRSARLMLPADLLGPGVQRALLVLFGAVACVLLIACANVANLLLVRAVAREAELSVRAALGAGRGRLIRQMLVESLVLGAGAGIAAIILASWGLDLIVSIRPDSLAELERVRIDRRVAGYAAALTLATSTLFGLLPGLRAAHAAGRLRTGARTIAGGQSTRRVTAALIVTEVALSLVLLTGAGLLVRTFIMLQSAPLNFDPDGLWVASAKLAPGEDGIDANRAGSFHEDLRDAVASLPGIRSAQLVSAVPSGYGASFGALAIDGAPAAEDAPTLFTSNFVEPEYFGALGMRFVEGRAFTEADGSAVVVVGEAFAQRFFGGGAVGHRIRLGTSDWRTIVGVAADVPGRGLARTGATPDQLHFPAGSFRLEQLLIDTDLSADVLAPAIRSIITRLDGGAALAELGTVEERLARSLDRQRFNLVLLLVLAGLATLLAAVGLYGVVSGAVAGRTREIGIRRALGATDARVVRLAVRDGMAPALVGIVIGLAGALVLTGLMTHMLYGLSPRDPGTLTTAPVLLGAIAWIASWLPGRRAARIQPVEALRFEE